MPYWFEPPTRELLRNYQAEPDRVFPVTGAARSLFSRIRRGGSGLSVLKYGSEYKTKELPSQNEIDAADAFYQGGRRYLVSNDEGEALVAAGFTVTPAGGTYTWNDLEADYETWDDVEAAFETWNEIEAGT